MKRRCRWVQRNIFILMMVVFITFFVQIDTTRAAPQLEVKAEVGVDNKIKLYTPLPIKLTITNNGSPFSGDLVIDAAVTFSAGSAQVYALDLAEGETKTITLYLDGLSDDYYYRSLNESLFSFYDGGIEKGKLIDYSGDKNIRFRSYYDGDYSFIFTYTENSDRLAALLRLSQYVPNNIEIFHLNQIPDYDFPIDFKGFAMADIFVVDEMNIADLSEEKQQAIYEWVENGGILLVGASEQVERSMGIFGEYLPLNLSSEKVIVTKEVLETLSKGGIFTEDIEVFRATEKEGSKRILADGNTILASSIDLGKGKIIQTTFSLGDQPLSTMDGYGKLINEILQLQSNSNQWNRGNFLDVLPYEVGNSNELFPSFQVKTPLIIITIILYMFIVGPILYLVLKKLDKREHAWWLIPVLSIVLTLSMFIVGAKDRIMQAQINQSAFYKVNGKNLSGYYVESILTNRGGDFVFTVDENTSAFAKRNYGMNTFGILHEKSYVKHHGNGTTIHLRNLNYWSVQSIIGETNIPNAGNFDIDLTVKDSKIEGTVKNNFPFAVKDVAIWSGAREILLGDIKPNETVKVSESLNSSILLKPIVYGNYLGTPKTAEELIPKRIMQLKYQALNLMDENQPVVIGWAEEAILGIQLDGRAEVNPIAVILQTFEPNLDLEGEFTVNDSMMETNIYPVNAGYMEMYNEQNNEWQLDPGEYEYIAVIPEELFDEKLQLTKIKISNHENKNLTISLWNYKTNRFEEIQEKEMLLQENLEQYISEYHEIKMLLQVKNNIEMSPIKLPTVEIQGVANK